MVADQRFASSRPDVLVFETPVLDQDLTFAGPVSVDFFFSTTGTDADFVVKIIDVLPDDAKDPTPNGVLYSGFQQMVRGDVFRGKFRNSYEHPEAFEPNKITEVKFKLNDIAHTFKKGHKIMIQVQHTWFPLVDRNPQKFMNIPDAKESDFQRSTNRFYHDVQRPSSVGVMVLKKN